MQLWQLIDGSLLAFDYLKLIYQFLGITSAFVSAKIFLIIKFKEVDVVKNSISIY